MPEAFLFVFYFIVTFVPEIAVLVPAFTYVLSPFAEIIASGASAVISAGGLGECLGLAAHHCVLSC